VSTYKQGDISSLGGEVLGRQGRAGTGTGTGAGAAKEGNNEKDGDGDGKSRRRFKHEATTVTRRGGAETQIPGRQSNEAQHITTSGEEDD
jgi:hypothetical protein